jgi:hypothetical protein
MLLLYSKILQYYCSAAGDTTKQEVTDLEKQLAGKNC